MEAHDSQSSQSSSVDGNCSLDTLTLARQEREKQGTWEVEVTHGGEADLHRHVDDCDKNPGHQKFIPVDQFNVEHLPSGYQDNDLVDWVRALSDLTVRVSVTYVSENRPKTVPGSDQLYPCYSNSGKNMTRVGSGWVDNVQKFPNEYYSEKSCPCKECLNSPTPKTQFAHIYIRTAGHVVYDELEAAHTTCHLFFDRGGRPDLCSGLVTLSGMSLLRSDDMSDYCEMYFHTHDLDLADKLDKMVGNMKCIHEKINNKYSEMTENDIWLAFVVSHPHGCSKQVSVGQFTNYKCRLNGGDCAVYTAATCSGSSGAPVVMLGLKTSGLLSHHCGRYPESTKFNYGAVIFIQNYYSGKGLVSVHIGHS